MKVDISLNLGDLIEIDQKIGIVIELKGQKIISLIGTNGLKQEFYYFPFLIISRLETTLKSIEL
jgi:hypothetical protein